MTRHFCTYFDQHYLTRGLVLFESLMRHAGPFKLWVLCMDDLSYQILQQLKLPNVSLITLEQFERGDAPLREARANRSRVEYYFTCTPSLPLFIFQNNPAVDRITYLDADLCFFSDLEPLFESIGSHSIAIIGHRFPPALQSNEVYGIYNVGLLAFLRDEHGLSCLRWWRDRCNEWCYARLDNGRYGDQKYLDDWTTRFPGVTVLDHKGVNVALWNLANYQIGWNGMNVMVDEQPLICFHFHALKRIRSWLFDLNCSDYQLRPSPIVVQRIFRPYLQDLRRADAEVRPLRQTLRGATFRQENINTTTPVHRPLLQRMKGKLEGALFLASHAWQRNYVLVLNRARLPPPSKRVWGRQRERCT
jgi:hypothetical protein